MDCCGNYPDYRHSAGGGGVLSPYHPYNQQSAMRYPQAALFHNGSVRPTNIYDSYDRFGYQPSPSYNPNYNGNIFGYNQTNARDNSFYGHHHPYDSFRIAPAYPYHHHHHHHNSREQYNPDVVYGSSRSGYVMHRDTLPSSYPYSAARNAGEYPYHHHHHHHNNGGGVPREFYQTSHHNLPNNADTAGAHHATESIYGEYPTMSASQFANGSNGFTSNSNATGTFCWLIEIKLFGGWEKSFFC